MSCKASTKITRGELLYTACANISATQMTLLLQLLQRKHGKLFALLYMIASEPQYYECYLPLGLQVCQEFGL